MKFFEYGKEYKKTLLLLNGYFAKWNPGLMPFVQAASKRYHVIVQAYDGFNEDEPNTIFHSVIDEAVAACDFLVNNFDGKIDIIYGISMGGMVANEILLDKKAYNTHNNGEKNNH